MTKCLYAEGVREFQPKVSTLGMSPVEQWLTPKVLANLLLKATTMFEWTQGRNPGLELANAFGVTGANCWLRLPGR